MKKFLTTSLFVLMLSFSYAQSTGTVSIGVGRYTFEETQDINQYAFNISMSKKLNKIFSIKLNASLYNEGKNTFTTVNEFPPFTITVYEEKFGGYSSTLNLDIFALGLSNNKLQTHIGFGGGFLKEENYGLLGLLTGYFEQQVVLNNGNSIGVGFTYSQELETGGYLSQFYFNIGKSF